MLFFDHLTYKLIRDNPISTHEGSNKTIKLYGYLEQI